MRDKSMESQQAVLTLYNCLVIKGFPEDYFGPDEILTRAQMATMLDNFIYANDQVEKGNYLAEDFK